MIKEYIPKLDDLWFREKLLSDSNTMSYNHHWGGTIQFPKEDWASWYDYWIINNDNERYYAYLANDNNEFVGEIAYHFDGKYYIANIIVYAEYRCKGYGQEGLSLLCKKALENGIRDAVDFGPFLIVNGKSSFINGNGGWGDAPRSAIAQRQDGIVLLLVIDGRQVGYPGADMNDLTKVLLEYGAINAANLDGGTSSAMEMNGEIITSPRNGNFQAKTRPVPNAWIVVE